jgi:hypothetical protein
MSEREPLAEHMAHVARALFGDPNPLQSKKGKPRWGRKGSLAVDERRGIWFDHENETGGGVLALIAREKGFSTSEAIEWMESIGCRIDRNGGRGKGAKPNGSKPARIASKPLPRKERSETYDYTDEDGELAFQVLRFVFRNPDGSLVLSKGVKPEKTFHQRRPDPTDPDVWVWGLGAGDYMRKDPGHDWYRFDEQRWTKLPVSKERRTVSAAAKAVPYRLPEITEAIARENPVFIVEGEQKADLLTAWNLAATCNAEGAGKWTAQHAQYLRGADVVILPDNDAPGREHSQDISNSLEGIAARVRILELPGLASKGDIVDWAEQGHTREELDALVEQAPEPRPTQHAQREQPIGRGLIVQRASDIKIEPVEWLWPGRIAIGKQTLIAGEAGLGKSQAAIAIAAAQSTGGRWPCEEGRAPLGSAIFLCAEDAASDTIVPRLIAAGADCDRVHIVSAVCNDNGKGHRAFNLQADLDLLENKIRELGDVRLVVIDPISSYMGPKIDSHVNAAVRGVLEPVGELAARLRVAIVSITHPPKGTGVTAINRFIGSVAFVAAARAAFMVARDAEDETCRLFLPVKNNLAPLGKGLAFRLEQRLVGPEGNAVVASNIAWEERPITVSADEALRAADEGNSDQRAIDEATEFLRDKLEGGAIPVREVEEHARALGMSKRTLVRARKLLQVRAIKNDFGTGWSLALPDKTGS